MKKRITILLLITAILICVVFIFSNSMKNREESSADSGAIADFFESITKKLAPDLDINWNRIVRKGAHFAEFFILGVFSILLFEKIVKKQHLMLICAGVSSAVIAFADEFIQQFTGRGPRITDVLIDVSGAVAGFCAVFLIRSAKNRKRNKENHAVKSEQARK